MDDIQSWWEVPSIAHFCSLFRAAFNLLDFDIEELEEALLTDGTEDPGNSLLQDLIVRLLCGCLGNYDISTFNFQMFLRRLFRNKCQEYGLRNPFNSDIDFQFLPLRTKVEILHTLCDFRLDADDVLELLKNLEADSLRVEPLGYDENNSTYWYFYGTRLYREDYPKIKKKLKDKKKRDSIKIEDKKRIPNDELSNDDSDEEQEIIGDPVWQVICYTKEDWQRVTSSFQNSSSKVEQELFITLAQDFLPEIPRLFEEKERLQKKRLYLPRRYSSRIDRLKRLKEEEEKKLEKKIKIERQEKKDSLRDRKKDNDELTFESKESLNDNDSADNKPLLEPPIMIPVSPFVGRQTNNSLSSATGKIVIQNRRTKLKTSQIFRQTEEDLQTGLYKILEYLKNHDDAWPFAEPVDEQYAPRYYSIINQPMDLGQMEDKLDRGEYLSLSAFKKDFQLIIDNCRRYNGSDNEYTEMASNLKIAFEQAAGRYLESDVSSDEEIAIEFHDSPLSNSFLDSTKELIQNQNNPKRKKKVSPLKNSPSKLRMSPFRDSKSPLKEILKSSPKSLSPIPDELLSLPSSPKEVNNTLSRTLPSPTFSNSKSPPRKHMKSPNRSEKIRLAEGSSSEKQKSLFKKRNKSPSRKKNKQTKVKSPFHQRALSPPRKRVSSPLLHVSTSPSPSPPPSKSTPIKNSPAKNKRANLRKSRQPKRRKNPASDDSDKDSIKIEPEETPPSPIPEVKPTKKRKPQNIKDTAAIEALEIATEQTLKDINKWLDETPRYSEFSSRSPSPNHSADEIDSPSKASNKIGAIPNSNINSSLLNNMKKDNRGLRLEKRQGKDSSSKLRKGTIDRLQPGKSKGNLLAKSEIIAIETSTGEGSGEGEGNGSGEGTSLSLGSVLAADILKLDPEAALAKSPASSPSPQPEQAKGLNSNNSDLSSKPSTKPSNLSAWFKAFGAPKRKDVSQNDDKRTTTKVQSPIRPIQPPVNNHPIPTHPQTTVSVNLSQALSRSQPPSNPTPHIINHPEEDKDRPSSTASSDRPDSRTGDSGPPIERQRKASTGSSVSERSSFSQDPDSGDLGGFPAPYPSPLHHSPDESTLVNESTYPPAPPPINGSLRVGFYQDTTVTKLSPEKTSPLPYNSSQGNSYSSLPFYEPIKTEQYRTQESPPFYASSSQTKPNVYPVKKRVYNEPQQQMNDPSNQGFVRTSYQSMVEPYPTSLPMYSQPKVPITTFNSLNTTTSPPTYSQSSYQSTLNQYELPHTSLSEEPHIQPTTETINVKPTRKRKTKAAFQEYQKDSVLPSTNQKDSTSITLNQKDTVPIALKTASVVPGSAFNFGPAPPGLAIYADKDTYPSLGFLEDYRSPSSFFIANSEEKPNSHAGFLQSGQPPNFAYGAGPAPPPPPPGPPLFQHILRHQDAVMLHPGLLGGPPPGFPRNYPPLDIRQQFDSLNRPSWP